MAEEKNTIILDFQVETGEVIAELEKTKKSIIGLKEEQAALNKAYKEGSITVDEYAQETVRVEQVMKKETQTYATLTKAVGAQTNSINALTAQNKALREERNNLDISTKAGAKRLEEINKQLDRNTEAITKNVSKLEQQKINIGNYASALDGLIPGFSSFTQGINGSTTAAKAFIATPLGAVIGALGLAVGALTAYFKGSEEGQNRLNKLVQIGTTIFSSSFWNLKVASYACASAPILATAYKILQSGSNRSPPDNHFKYQAAEVRKEERGLSDGSCFVVYLTRT